VRDLLHADDMITLYFAALETISAARGNAFNVALPTSLSLPELFGLLEEFSGVKLAYTKLAPRESDQRLFVADITKVNRLIGWEPRVSARDGVYRMLVWVSQY